MSDTLVELSPASSDDIIAITQEVWSSFLDLELEAAPVEMASLCGPVLSATVQISGAWEGAVRLECSEGHAAAAAARMFAGQLRTVTDEQASDALGELTNVVTGNIKSLLPAPSALSMPSVQLLPSHWADQEVEHDGGLVLLRRIAFLAAPGSLHVSVWKAETS